MSQIFFFIICHLYFIPFYNDFYLLFLFTINAWWYPGRFLPPETYHEGTKFIFMLEQKNFSLLLGLEKSIS